MTVLKNLGKLLTKKDLQVSTRAHNEPCSNLITPKNFPINKTHEDKRNPKQTHLPKRPSVAISFKNEDKKHIHRKGTLGKSLIPMKELKELNRGFNKKIVHEYLSPLSKTNFKRLDPNLKYDFKKAEAFTTYSKTVQRNLVNGLTSNVESINYQKFLSKLLSILMKNSTHIKQLSAIPNFNYSLSGSNNIYLNYTCEEVPALPDFDKNPELFENYIGILTHTNFLYKNSSRLNGIIPKILRNLMHPSNIKTLKLRTVNTYNDVIYYFGTKHDFASSREVFAQMKLESCSPNTRTYNLLLRNILRNLRLNKSKPIYDEVIFYLEDMESHGVKPDLVTWLTCYNFLNENLSRQIFIEQMISLGFPITNEVLYAIVKTSDKIDYMLQSKNKAKDNTSNNDNDHTLSEILGILKEHKIPLNLKLFNYCIKKLLYEDNYPVAMKIVEYAINNQDSDSKLFKPNHKTLNLFLVYLANKGRLDLSIMTFNTFASRFKIKPTIDSFNQMFKALVRNGYSTHFSVVSKIIHTWQNDWNCGRRQSYWHIKAQAISKFNCQAKEVGLMELEEKSKLLKNLIWSKDLAYTIKVWNECKHLHYHLRYLGCIPPHMKGTIGTSLEKN
ncbi:hypothetical protein TBLA_0B04880 [Henningerozyma blattae CBS 6284]|uniref:Mitochondrial 15S rRNA processing factor CCM1 n=1 Tax=Henningerozyma blattae (strain ATCC 34711 / CBS 6284 / DSM 70876 / NBRC 10599 / NRRL Y-10934 / UCD 77-7) TaxID=1071380 RepID=I2GYX0_HENB6|nr:hypothetical protein TBLA_0B04880 [Tetrapisispora blattae CBS 6284]CCH59322.1 hypothetical protein TBLA_0B04880 [Tetrapisispora blattae CBS 6284]